MSRTEHDADLIANIRRQLEVDGSAHECDESEAIEVIEKAIATFAIKKPSHWWWSSIGVPHELYFYAGQDLDRLLRSVLSGSGRDGYLLLSDGRPIPWPVYRGSIDSLLRLIEQLPRHLEFGLVDVGYDWLVLVNSDDDNVYTVGLPKIVMA